ncbi:hypothetical protein THRCLA_21827 [Thraustotheca clavata]|uniref:FYVE-type domain-containing protein n=1 Tax=Thraustotheca clavata TaxID=74557 RepID=A0A1V9ZND9_9STRA|nr:hypothetical protein THRCLA_21827 [Thraustotheca clavata]
MRYASDTHIGLENFITTGAQVRRACSKSQWSKSRTCSGCDRPFHLFRWRHNCYVCGDVICGECSWTVYLVNTRSNVGRACYPCSRSSSCSNKRSSDKSKRTLVKRSTCPSILDSQTPTEWIDLDESIHSETSEQVKCTMCQKEMVTGDAIATLPCKEAFHLKCLTHHLTLHDNSMPCHTDLSRDMAYIRNFFTFKSTES